MNSLIRRLSSKATPVRFAEVATGGNIEVRAPSHQNAVDLIPGWNHAFPDRYGLKAGSIALFDDPRIHWAIEQFGDLADKRVLELGPLEAAHTSMLDRCNPAVLDVVEANVAAYLRCLIAKQVYDLRRARFHLGNFVPWLERSEFQLGALLPWRKRARRYDLIIGSGVLYHMHDPVHLLELMARRADAVYLWTHYFDAGAMPQGDLRGFAFTEYTRTVRRRKLSICLHSRSYHGAERNLTFCGGLSDLHYWMEKPAILDVLRLCGFDDIRTAHDEPSHPNGPAISIFARRSDPRR